MPRPNPRGKHVLQGTGSTNDCPLPAKCSAINQAIRERVAARVRVHLRDELGLFDMRGTAAKELLRADCSLNENAVAMGWGLGLAANIIEKYFFAVLPHVADEILDKLSTQCKKRDD